MQSEHKYCRPLEITNEAESEWILILDMKRHKVMTLTVYEIWQRFFKMTILFNYLLHSSSNHKHEQLKYNVSMSVLKTGMKYSFETVQQMDCC